MLPYGWPPTGSNVYRDEDYGPTSKHCKMTSKNRRAYRRTLKKMGRRDGRRMMAEQLIAKWGR